MNLANWQDTGDRFTWRGQRVFYQEAGEGEAIFLLHGFLTSSWIFKLIWPSLTKHYRIIAPDYIGFGFSSKPKDYNYGIDEKVGMIYALADLLNIDRCHVMAHSFSVNVGQEMLRRQVISQPKLCIISMLMINGALFPDVSRPSLRQQLMLNPLIGKSVAHVLGKRSFKNGLRRRVGKYSIFPDDLLDELFYQLELEGGLRLVHKMNQYILERNKRKKYLQNALIDTNVPVQLLWGIDKEDQIAGLRLAHKYRELKGDQYVVMLKGIGHFPTIECPEVVLDYYYSFLNGVSAPD